MKKSKLPKTDSIEILARFWATHDLTDFDDKLEEVAEPVFVRDHAIKRTLMNFPAGFVGFVPPAHPTVGVGIFKTICYAAARELGGKVLSFEFANITPNYHCASLEWGYDAQEVRILCNRWYWIVGFAKPKKQIGDIFPEYIDSAELANVLRLLSDGWVILSKAELEAVVDESALASMDEEDREWIEKGRRKGWWFGPDRTVGDFIFNHSH